MSQIQWPAIIKLSGEDELIFLPDQTSLHTHAQLNDIRFAQDDYLYDSVGREYLVDKLKLENPTPTGRHLSLEEAVQLIRLHSAQDGACCVAKFNARSITEAFALLG